MANFITGTHPEPRSHQPFKEGDPQRALGYLGCASRLHGRLDVVADA